MRDVLSSDLYGTSSADGRANDKIGVMPDLKKIIDDCLPVIITENGKRISGTAAVSI